MNNTASRNHMSPIMQAMVADHRLLEASFERVMASLRGADVERTRQCWLALDRALERHLTAAEELLLPRFAQALPEAAERLRREHGEIRRALVQLGVDLDLHELSPASAAGFIATLRRHAAFEDAQLYPWAQGHLDEAARLSLLARLRSHVHVSRRAEESNDVDEPELS